MNLGVTACYCVTGLNELDEILCRGHLSTTSHFASRRTVSKLSQTGSRLDIAVLNGDISPNPSDNGREPRVRRL
ncbi:hypothetical protein EXIGLDRAFT_716964 [Exidia glandulosa HHB12029]|uniref:Uncharacterized protein n=1 Tax=Exidia glandulosa HHB12029 TaxID=1314781 RepID=A0A165IM88_EXIGL|nr:hypothetical protein EXIGLDRAFT_716964 [Exidia glandulosa HHB12029]